MKIRLTILLLIFCFFIQNTLFSQIDSLDVYNMSREEIMKISSENLSNLSIEQLLYLANKLGISMDELLNMHAGIASKSDLTPREAPGIVSIISEDEIKKSGAKTLQELLNLIPGFYFGYDIDEMIGPGMRGIWGNEGKILFLMNGIQLNENLYSTSQFASYLALENIEKIEIIRGPGSSIYGGYAELGVVNIITRKEENTQGVNIGANYGLTKNNISERGANLFLSSTTGKLKVNFSANGTDGNRSDRILEGLDTTYDLNNGSSAFLLGNSMLNMEYQNLELNLNYANYKTHVHGYADYVLNSFEMMAGQIKYKAKINDKLNITPSIDVNYQMPWNFNDTTDGWLFKQDVIRYSSDVFLNYDLSKKINITGGIAAYYDKAKNYIDSMEFSNGENTIDYNNISFYTQGLFKTNFANITLGARGDKHNQFGFAFSPRVGMTKIIGNFHGKILLSKAFRAPSFVNMDLSPDIKPERTTVIELETGYKINQNHFIKINFFDITILDPIVYSIDSIGEYYKNHSQTGTRGFELEYMIKYNKAFLNLSASYYDAAGKNRVEDYFVYNASGTVNPNILLGSSKLKLAAFGSYSITKNFSINPSVIWFDKKYAYTEYDELGKPMISEIKPEILANLFLNYENLFINNLEFGIGVNNILNSEDSFVQPYNGDEAPYPGRSREFFIKLSYNFMKEQN